VNLRVAELSLIVFSIVLAVGLFIATDFATGTSLAADTLGFVAAFAAIAIGAHAAVRRFAPQADPLILPLAMALVGVGLAMIRRMDAALGGAQLIWAAIAFVAFAATLAVVKDHRKLGEFRYSMLLLGVVLLLLPLTPIGTDLGRSARLWVSVAGMNFQPAEAAKIVLSLFLAGYLASKRELMTLVAFRLGPIGFPAPRHFGPLLIAWGMSLAIMFYERDLGSSLLFFSLFLATIYMATSRAVFVVAGLGMFAAGVGVALQRFSHVQVRVDAWLNPWSDDPVSGILAGGRQIAQSWYALGAGGMAGTGIGRGHPELIDPGIRSGTLPTDFIFAAIGEELGFLGAVGILLIFGLIMARGFTIALRSTDSFGSLLAGALTVILGLQAFLIMGGVTRLLPLTGITLPFVSYGGSSLVANAVLLALLIRVSDRESRLLPEELE
jgi:cell division protein FtsW (lipid II flippase)